MSTSVNPSAAPLEAPPPAGLEPISPEPQPKRRWKIWLGAVLIAVAGIAAWYVSRPRPAQNQPQAVTVRTAAIAAGTLEQTIRITGNTVAGNYANIVAPLLRGPEYRNLTLVTLAKPGSMAKKGQVVAQMDTQAARDHIDDVQAMVVSAEADIRKRKAEQAIEEENLRQSIRVAKSTLDKSKLDIGAADIRTPIDQELLKLAVAENEAAYKDALQDYDINLVSNRAEIRILEITLERQVRHRERHVTDLVKFTIKAPMDGLVVMSSVWRGGDMGQVQVGDQLSPNQPFMKIVDPQSMRLEATVNQVQAEFIRVGQPVTARFDAFPGLHLKGKIYSIGAIAVGGWRQNYYIRNIPIKVMLLEQDPRVIPDLSASAEVLVSRQENALLAPREAIQYEGGKPVVYVKQAGMFTPREVEMGAENNTHVAIASGLKAGDVVALQRPATTRKK